MAERTRSERNTLTGRVKRYAKVGAAVGGLATRFAGSRILGVPWTDTKRASELKQALGGLKGPLMKVAQMTATIPDMLPTEYTQELGQLQTNAPSMGWPFVKRRMAAELGAKWQEKFASFEHEAVAAASLGQVHRATGRDARPLACKLQYPDMGSAVEADLQQLKLVFAIYKRYDRAIDPSEIHAELLERLREELDYEREVRHMAAYEYMLEKESGVHVPDAVPALSTKRLLTMTWLEGARLMRVVDRPLAFRNKVAYNMFRAWYVPFYGYGVIHGDPHLGNYTVREDASINLLDFGCIRVFKPSFIRAVIDLYRALRDDDEDLAVKAYETWGFKKLSRETIAILSQWAMFLYGPLLKDRAQEIQETGGTAYGATVAAKVHGALRKAGGVKPPREFVLMDRAAIGLGSVFTHLRAKINWHRLFHELIDGFEEDALARRQKRVLPRFRIPLP